MSAPSTEATTTCGAALRIEDLVVTYGTGHRALDGVSLNIEPGECVAVVGSSGSGKTTLMRALMGLLPASAEVSGRVRIGESDVLGLPEGAARKMRGRSVGYVSQDPYSACDPLRTVGHHIGEAWAAHRISAPRERICEDLEKRGIDAPAHRIRQYPHQWSGGMLQRGTTYAATAHRPILTLADEPTSALDAHLADEALTMLRAESGALLVVTHDLALAARHVDRVLVLDDGQVIESGPATRVFECPEHPRTARLLAASAPGEGSLRLSREPAAEPAPVVIRAERITKSYSVGAGRIIPAITETSVEVRAGEVLGIIGPSGSGKSTLLRMLAGMERPDSGEIVAEGAAVWLPGAKRARLPRKGFAMPVFQDPVSSVDPRWPLWRSITEPLTATGMRMSREERRARAAAELSAVGLSGVSVDRRPGSLSVGQCQRVAVVRALIAHPAVVAADEPTASLDVETAELISLALRRAADRGAAVIVVSHDEVRLRSYADRIRTVSADTST